MNASVQLLGWDKASERLVRRTDDQALGKQQAQQFIWERRHHHARRRPRGWPGVPTAAAKAR